MKSTVRDYAMLADQIRDIATMLGEDVERPAWQGEVIVDDWRETTILRYLRRVLLASAGRCSW